MEKQASEWLWEVGHSDWPRQGWCTPWQGLDALTDWLWQWGASLGDEYRLATEGVWIHNTADVSPLAVLCAPCVVCAGAVVGPWAYIRGSVLVGQRAVVGHACEVKNAVLFDEAKAAHYNYVGDSVLGWRAHLGAGAVCANLRWDGKPVQVQWQDKVTDSGRRKLGALVGDGAEIGCNSVLCPGTVVMPHARVLPTSCAKHIVR